LRDLVQVPEPFIKDQLNMLPSGLEETYLGYLRKINAQPQTSRTLAQRCFLWAFHSNIRLSYGQFKDAVSLDLKTSGNLQPHSAKTLNQVTKDLLNVTEFTLLRVRPVHYSLQEYAKNSSSLPSDLREFLLPDSDSANEQLAFLCLEHLMVDADPSEDLYTILCYCATHFSSHIQRMAKIPEALIDLFDRIFIKERHFLLKILTWRWPICHENYPDVCCVGSPNSVDPVFFMKCTGLDKVGVLWERYSNMERPTSYPDGYLHVAVVARLEDVIKDMIAEGVDLDRLDAGGLSPLHYSCGEAGDAFEIVKLLVEGGANINLCGGGQAPLTVAKRCRYAHIADFLEGMGAIE
jgi:ankyrin repeat protein